MDMFAHAAFGLVLPAKGAESIVELYEEFQDYAGRSNLVSDELADFNRHKPLQLAIRKLGFPPKARVHVVNSDASAFENGTLIIGWGVIGFHKVVITDQFKQFLSTKLGKKCQWVLWVE